MLQTHTSFPPDTRLCHRTRHLSGSYPNARSLQLDTLGCFISPSDVHYRCSVPHITHRTTRPNEYSLTGTDPRGYYWLLRENQHASILSGSPAYRLSLVAPSRRLNNHSILRRSYPRRRNMAHTAWVGVSGICGRLEPGKRECTPRCGVVGRFRSNRRRNH